MGETQGSMWTTGLYIILFTGMVSTLFLAIDIMTFYSELYAIDDNIRAGNFEYLNQVGERFNSCGEYGDISEDCTGIIEVNSTQHYVKYQISYNGRAMDKVAQENSHIVLLPY